MSSEHRMYKILFVTSEAHPLIKTGGLGDVSASLPAALKALGQDVRLLLPGYRDALRAAGELRLVASFPIHGGAEPVRLLEGHLPGTEVPCWFVYLPRYFDRPGHPYLAPDGHDWPDNAARFTAFCRSALTVARDRAGLAWTPDVVHCQDWQTGLVPALLARESPRPATVFSIHNLAYQGLFPWHTFLDLGLPLDLWAVDAMEFYGRFSFIKGGLVFADRLSTVSPTYAREILTPAFGFGLEGVLRLRADRLVGILNGIDYKAWNPASDPFIAQHYDAHSLDLKRLNKSALQQELGLPPEQHIPLIGMVGRLVEQKGFDLMLNALRRLMEQETLQWVVLGSGERRFEQALHQAARRYPERIAVHIGYHEALAHRVEAGVDLFLMPSRFEPCGLNQMYSLRYGTLPIVHRTGGLADTVVDATEEAMARGVATGFVFDAPTPPALSEAVTRALRLYRRPELWRRLQVTGMRQDFSWESSASHYLDLYRQALQYGLQAP
jgi:starch synthase